MKVPSLDQDVSSVSSILGMGGGFCIATASAVIAGLTIHEHWGVILAVVLANLVWGAAYAASTFLIVTVVENLRTLFR